MEERKEEGREWVGKGEGEGRGEVDMDISGVRSKESETVGRESRGVRNGKREIT